MKCCTKLFAGKIVSVRLAEVQCMCGRVMEVGVGSQVLSVMVQLHFLVRTFRALQNLLSIIIYNKTHQAVATGL